MARGLHDKGFDSATRKKLGILRDYVRYWYPVFMSRRQVPTVQIYDFFAGPGSDAQGYDGSPLVILKEVQNYLADTNRPKAPGVQTRLLFNDSREKFFNSLVQSVANLHDPNLCQTDLRNLDFPIAFKQELPNIASPLTANLVFLDQYGIRHVTEETFHQLISCSRTDIVFFLSSTIIKRFIEVKSVGSRFPVTRIEVDSVPMSEIHRFMCDRVYRGWVPEGVEYHLASFSLKKDESHNVYGLIFGSSSLLGLEKFLHACWKADPLGGQANFNIEGDSVSEAGELPLWQVSPETKKHVTFRTSLLDYIRQAPRDNRELYRYSLENGFLPTHSVKILEKLRAEGRISVERLSDEVKHLTFRIGWKYYSNTAPEIIVKCVED